VLERPADGHVLDLIQQLFERRMRRAGRIEVVRSARVLVVALG
jgi:hypothetical protein